MTTPNSSTFDRIAAPYDRGMAPLERLWLREMRAQLLPQARGRVLEVGVGTGANLPFYPAGIRLTAIDESADMLAVAARRAAALGRDVSLLQADAEQLPFPGGRFDTVVTGLVLCSVLDLKRALAEMRRVLRRPGGRLLLLEHMRPRSRFWAKLVDLVNKPWYAWNGRCHLNRETQRAVAQAGFAIEQVEPRLGGIFRSITARIS